MDEELRRDLKDQRHIKVRPLARALNITPNTIYAAMRRGEIASSRIGRSLRVPPEEAARLLGIGAA